MAVASQREVELSMDERERENGIVLESNEKRIEITCFFFSSSFSEIAR